MFIKKKSTPKIGKKNGGKRNKQKRKNYLYLEIEKTCSAMDFASVLGREGKSRDRRRRK
jgi:hypothetical protein